MSLMFLVYHARISDEVRRRRKVTYPEDLNGRCAVPQLQS